MVANVPGRYVGSGLLRLMRGSRLWLRAPAEAIPQLLPLAGRSLEVGGHSLRLGVPQVRALTPAAVLVARVVTLKGCTEAGRFLEEARRKLDALGVRGELEVPAVNRGERTGELRRHVLRIKGARLVGFPLHVRGLTAEESIQLQESGLGGRHHLGCGFFIPWTPSRR
jgi:CRISPR-associated protein Cas6